MLKLNSTFWYADVVSNGIQTRVKRVTEGKLAPVVEKVVQQIQDKEFGFVNMLGDSQIISSCEAVIDKIAWAETLVVVGIGGSDLGGRTIQNALGEHSKGNNTGMKVIFFGESTDPTELDRLLSDLNLETTVFNIVSKSGSTIETLAQYFYFKQLYKQKGVEKWQGHFIFTTDPEGGVLNEEADEYGVMKLEIPADVGGRFSVLSAVGILPTLAMGLDPEQLWAGAKSQLDDFTLRTTTSLPAEIAFSQLAFFAQAIPTVVMMPYSARLQEFGRWFRQLWAESLGKEGTGILPIQARGPADQHSQLQFYTQGNLLSSFLFLRVQDPGASHIIKDVSSEKYKFLKGTDFAQIIQAEQSATAQALQKAGRPSATIEIAKLDEFNLGELFMCFQLAVVILGEAIGIDPFDQPGVEESKKLIRQLLGGEIS